MKVLAKTISSIKEEFSAASLVQYGAGALAGLALISLGGLPGLMTVGAIAAAHILFNGKEVIDENLSENIAKPLNRVLLGTTAGAAVGVLGPVLP